MISCWRGDMDQHHPSGDARESCSDAKEGVSVLGPGTQRAIVAAGRYGSLPEVMTRQANLFCLEKKSKLLFTWVEYTCAWDSRFQCSERSLTLDSENLGWGMHHHAGVSLGFTRDLRHGGERQLRQLALRTQRPSFSSCPGNPNQCSYSKCFELEARPWWQHFPKTQRIAFLCQQKEQ